MRFQIRTVVSGVLMSALFAGCASVVPRELTNARAAYERARLGPAAQVVPAELHKAHESLAAAERSFVDEPESQHTRDLAYVAERKTQLAEALASRAIDNKKKANADLDYKNTQTAINQDQRNQLANAHGDLADAALRSQSQKTQIGLERQGRVNAEQQGAESARLGAEAERRGTEAERKGAEAEQKGAASEARARSMMENLARLAAVKEEQRGLVITLSGSVLFASDQSALLPAAQTRLNQVAEALLASKERTLVIEGHTDSRGSDSNNVNLSQRRADSVRTYLIGRGYGADNISARGIGEGTPVADNASAEGRANNRRVEIVVTPEKLGLGK